MCLSVSLNVLIFWVKCTATSYETRGACYIWREAWCALTDNDRLFSGNN